MFSLCFFANKANSVSFEFSKSIGSKFKALKSLSLLINIDLLIAAYTYLILNQPEPECGYSGQSILQ